MERFLVLLFFTLSALPLFAIQARPGRFPEDQKIAVSLSPFFTTISGYSDELVFGDESGDYPYLSRLTWDIKPALVLGQSASLVYRNRYSLNLALGTALNKSSGEMSDRDWIEDYFDDVDTEWTHESVSDIDFTSSLILDVNAAARVYRYRWFRADLILGYKFMEWGWSDEITSISYPTGNYDYLIGENGIDYDVEYRIPYFGINLEAAGGLFSGGVSLLFSPFVSVDDHDHHILRGLHFYDSFSGGKYYGASVYLNMICKRWLSIGLSGDIDYVPEFKGNTTVYNESGNMVGYYSDEAGVEYLSYSFSVSVAFHF